MSKTTAALAGIVILSMGVLAAWSVPQGEDPAVLLRAAIEKEEVDGNLEAAIAQYKHVIKIAGANRAVAAQALLRLGGCYEKRGPEEARRTYQQLIRDYGEQAKEVAAARQRLAALTAGAPAPARAGDSRLTIRRVPNLDMFAKPSPDGKYLAFVDWKSGNLALLDVAAGTTRVLTKDASFVAPAQAAQFSAWSRDSSRIAYEWSVAGPKESREELRIISVNGDTPPMVIPIAGAGWIMPRDWSPDGTRVFLSYGTSSRSGTVALVGPSGRTIDKLDWPRSSWVEYRFTDEGNGVLYSAAADGKAGPNDIFLRDLKTAVTTPLVQHPAEDLLVGVLPGTDWLFFASDRQGRLDLWAVRVRRGKADGQPVLVKQGLGRFYPLGFTNDGRYYYATLSATDDVYLADVDPESGTVTGEARKLTTRWDGVSGEPSFSPDGASVAYVVKRSAMPIPTGVFDTLVVQSLKDQNADPVVVGFEDVGLSRVGGPCWSADGKAVVVGGYGGERRGKALYRVDVPSLRKTMIYAAKEGRPISHECATDGGFIYVRLGTSGFSMTTELPDTIVRIDASGTNEREVFRTEQGQRIASDVVAQSPDGRVLSVVTALDRNRRALLVMPSEGGTPRQILEFRQPTGGWVDHVWAPDGRSILYVEGPVKGISSLRRVRTEGGGAEPETIYQWTVQFFGLRFHPNGRLLTFTGRPNYSPSSEVWVIENLREELKLLARPGKRP